MSTNTATDNTATDTATKDTLSKARVVDMVMKTQSDALQVMCHFLQLAQLKGVYNIEESAKIWEAIGMFIIRNPDAPSVDV